MDATPIDFMVPYAHDAAQPGGEGGSALAQKWAALHAVAELVASLGHVEPGPVPEAEVFGPALERAGGWRLDLARQGVDDIAAMLEPGLSALLTVHGQGGDTRAAATALWHEFDRARQPLLALAHAAQDIG